MFNLKKIVFIFIYVVEKVARNNQSGSAFQRLSIKKAHGIPAGTHGLWTNEKGHPYGSP
jgi:hypothetical protein